MSVSFAETLDSQDVGVVLEHVGNTLSKTNRAINFIMTICASMRDEADKTSALVQEEFTVLRTEKDCMESSEKPWKTFLAQQQRGLVQKNNMINNLLDNVLLPMRTFYDSRKKVYESLRKKYNEANENIKSMLKELERKKSKSVKAIGAVQSKENNPGKLFSDMTKTTWSKVFQHCRLYDEQLSATNLLCQTYHDVEMPKILGNLQRIEEERVKVFKIVFREGIEITKKYHADCSFNVNLESLFGRNNIEEDMSKFVQDVLGNSHTRSTYPRMVTYDLPLRLKEIEENANVSEYSSTKKAPMDLQSSPEKIVEDQKKMFPQLNLTLPRVFLLFKRAIEDLGGLEKEGIFRVSSNFTEVDRVYNSIVCGNYEVEFDDAHIAAQCLKKWLREMQDPLFPPHLNGKIIEALGMLDTDLDFAESAILQVFRELSVIRQLIIKGLVRLMRDIALPENVRINKMTISNLCVVFAPSFMRNEDTTIDPMVAFKVAESAAQALEVLVRIIDVRDYPDHEEIISASPFVTPVQARNYWKRAPLQWSEGDFSAGRDTTRLTVEVEDGQWNEQECERIASIRQDRYHASKQNTRVDAGNDVESEANVDMRASSVRSRRAESRLSRQCQNCEARVRNGKICYECWTPLE